MKKGRLILLLVAASLIIIGTSLAQETGVIESGTMDVGNEEIVDLWQIMTEVDSGECNSSWGDFSWTDIPLLSGETTLETGDRGEGTGDQEPWTWNLEPDPIFHLIISEVYYDGTDEWIEITNIGDSNFQGTFTIAGVKSSLLTLTDVSLLSGQSKIFGDTLSQVSGNRFIGKTGLSLNMIDTAPIVIQLTVSGQVGDEFLVDSYRVNFYNDKKTSFEKLNGVSTRVQTGRIVNALSGYMINPGSYGGLEIPTNVAFPPGQSWENSDLPIPCVSLDQRWLLKVVEIFPGNEIYPPYIELAVSGSITIDSLSISGNLLRTGLVFSWDNSGTTLENGSFFLISSSGYRNAEGFQSVRNDDFSLVSTWNRLVITIGYRQSRRVMDIVYHSGDMIGSSYYFNGSTRQCAQVLDSVDYFSPGFERRFLKYMSGLTMTKIEYLRTGISAQSSGNTCPSVVTGGIFSWENQVVNTGFVTWNYIINIIDLVYDPEGSDTDNETVTLLAHHVSGDTAPLDLSKIFRLKVNGTNKTLPRTLPMDKQTTFTKNFGFPNSTKDGSEVVIQLTYGEYIFDIYKYNPNIKEEIVIESWLQLTGEEIITGILYDFSWVTFEITYVLPNPKGKDTVEELGLQISNEWLVTRDSGLVTKFDLSQGFTLRREKTKKKLSGFVIEGQENILSWNLGLVNKTACISLFYQEQELTKFCYRTPKEGEKIYASDTWLAVLAPQDLSIMTSLQLKKIENELCIRYDGQSYLCKKIPAGKAAFKTTQEQKLYKGFSSLIKSYLINDWQPLYYDTDIKRYFDLLAESKKLISKWQTQVDIYGQKVPVTDIKKQLEVIEHTPIIIIVLFEGAKALLGK